MRTQLLGFVSYRFLNIAIRANYETIDSGRSFAFFANAACLPLSHSLISGPDQDVSGNYHSRHLIEGT